MGLSQLVTITVPKKPERKLTKDLSSVEVEGRLKALAMTMDSRGWAVKNVITQPTYLQEQAQSDRLIGVSDLPKQAQIADVHPADDILDEDNNPVAQKLTGLIKKKDEEYKQGITEKLKKAKKETDSSKSEAKTVHKVHAAAQTASAQQAKPRVTEEAQAVKLELAQSGNDLSVASIEKLANREPKGRQISPNEVEISLH
jgi:hypothetical protein